MKRTIILMAMALMVSVAFGQTVNKLIEKYRQLPNAQYMDTSKETLKFYDENPDPALTEKERAQLKKNFKMSETVQLEKVDEEQLAQLEEDIKALKGYEMLFVTNKNGGSDEDANVLRQMMSEVFNPTIKLQCYGKVKGNKVSDLLMKVKAWETVVLMHIDTKVEKELVVKSIMEKEAVSYEQENGGDVVDMKDVLEDVKNGNVLFVINGEEHPDFHSAEEARDYMINNGIHWNIESWVIGTSVKEKYPNTDRKVVIEYSATKVEDGNVLIVIEGKEHPELNSEKEAEEYMKSNGIKWNNKYTMERSMVKKRYPHTDKKYAIEYSLKSNEDILREDAAFDPNVGEWHYVDEEEEYSQTDKKVVIGSEDNGTTFYLPSKTEIMNCVILLNGKYRPEFHNEDEVIKYLSDEDGVLNGEYGVHYYFDQEKASKYDKTKKVVADITFTEAEDEE